MFSRLSQEQAPAACYTNCKELVLKEGHTQGIIVECNSVEQKCSPVYGPLYMYL